jgi:glycosyltransferase involved in cell wall biosynthesis
MTRRPETEQPIRVLHIVSGVDIGNIAGGAESYALRLVGQFDRATVRPALFAMRRAGTSIEREWLERLAQQDIPVYGLNDETGSRARNIYQAVRSFRHTLSTFRPQIVNSHSERGDLLNCLARLLGKGHPAAVQTVHIDLQWGTRPWFGWSFTQGIAPVCFKAQIAVSDTIRRMLDRKLMARIRSRSAYIGYNGIDEVLFDVAAIDPDDMTKQSCCKPVGLPNGRPSIGIVGRLTDQKGHSDALKAVALVNRVRTAHLLVLGTGPLEAELRTEAAALEIGDKVHFLGWREDVTTILPHLDLLLSASLWEGFPTVLLEAMAKGTPVVATDVSGSRELVVNGETGILTPPEDPERLAESILTLLNDPALASNMAATARENVRLFTIQNTARQYEQIYVRLLEERARR